MYLLELKGINRTFPETGTRALSDASFQLRAGEIHALVGENGAGKSTLARILSGLIKPDSGQLYFEGKEVAIHSVRDAEKLGIGLVPQDSFLADELSVLENLSLGREPLKAGIFLSRKKAFYEICMLARDYGINLNPDALVQDLPPSRRREAEILRAMSRGSKVLILDEPTSILSDEESGRLFALLEKLKKNGNGIIYISHRVREILAIADRITVLKNGKNRGTVDTSGMAADSLAKLIMENEIGTPQKRAGKGAGKKIFECMDIVLDKNNNRPFSFSVEAGEIMAIAAIQGNALDRLEAICAGLLKPLSGRALLNGRQVSTVRGELVRQGEMAYIPTERESLGLSGRSSGLENILARSLNGFSFTEWASGKKPRQKAAGLYDEWQIRGNPLSVTDSLSGGNRQKLVAARELDGCPDYIMAANPAQGLDPDARAGLWQQLARCRDSGSAILLLSHDPADLAEIADRTFVLYRSRLLEVESEAITEGRLAAFLTGAVE